MTLFARNALETLWDDGSLVLSRGILAEDAAPVLLLAAASERSASAITTRLQQIYALREELRSASVARPLKLVQNGRLPALVLEDPGGSLLARLLGKPWELSQFLRSAIGMAAALGRLHARGLIHGDLNPATVLVRQSTGQAWLICTSLASRLPRGQIPASPEEITVALAYMAPEQTGRMNRSIDARSDLYSFGVTLYEMLTGSLPFAATDPMEWAHCHIARQPISPSERSPHIPEVLSAITMKLLGKTAEKRYQTAAGLEKDLRRCLAACDSGARIEPFQLGVQDTSDRLVIPEKLYGRDAEREILLGAFDRVVTSGRPEVVLISGYAGIGKSSIVSELHKVIAPARGVFVSGKFDQHKRDIPYATLALAFQSPVRQILGKSQVEVCHWQNAIRQAVGINGQLMVNLIPELELVIGKQPPVQDLPLEAAQNRFQMVFVRFLGVFARAEHVLVLFLDDLQWLDPATLELLTRLVSEPDLGHFLLIGAYRDSEVSHSHSLAQTLAKVRKANAAVKEIVLAPLTAEHLERLVMDTFHCEANRAQPLARLIHEKTDGNPFFTIQFLTALAEEGLLTFDQGSAVWKWDLLGIRAKRYTDDVVELVAEKLKRLPQTTQKVLKRLASLGNGAKISTLNLVYQGPEQSVLAGLWEAVRAGLIFNADGVCTFIHDRIREAAYSLIPENKRAATHLRIGRLLVLSATPQEIEEAIFEIVNQFNRAAPLITDWEERKRVAELNFIAGKRAKVSEAYGSALSYFTASETFLAEGGWNQDRTLAFNVALNRAECEFRIGLFAESDDRLSKLWDHAANRTEASAVTCLRVALYITQVRFDRAVEVCLEYLRGAGLEWSPNPTKEEIEREFAKIWQQLGAREIEQLIDLPLTNDADCQATLDVLSVFTTPAWFTDVNLHDLAVAHIANLSLQHGNSDGSCYAYAVLGAILGPVLGQYQASFRFGKLAIDLVEKYGLNRFKARVCSCFGHHILPWTQHLQGGRVWNRRAISAGKESGDLPFAAFSYSNLIANLIAGGDPLEEVQREAEEGREFARKIRFDLVSDYITGQLSLIRTLRGLTPNFGSFDDVEFEENRFEEHLQGNPRLTIAACRYWIRKLQARFHADDYASAIAAASKADLLVRRPHTFFDFVEYPFYSALAYAAAYNSASADKRAQYLQAAIACYKQLAVWSENCPQNFAGLSALVAAEIARIEGRELEAERLYEEAIQSSRANGFVHNEAIAHEVAARFYIGRRLEIVGQAYLQNARNLYWRWGAFGKTKHLELRYSFLSEKPAGPADNVLRPSLEQVDVLALAKASQAVSSELDPRKLIETLLVIALENAGAQRGVLILLHGDEPQTEAEATTGANGVTVHFRQGSLKPFDMSDWLLRYVIRTRDCVIVDDAAVPNLEVKFMRGSVVAGTFSYRYDEFLDEGYVRQACPRSILCLPLVKQAELIGVLYLENNLAPGVFTTKRLAMLELLASQAAISFDHARLVAQLTQENIERRRAEEELRRKEGSLREAQTELAHVSRVTTLGELAASIAHEVNQPLAGIVYNASASLRWLEGDEPDLDETREAIRRIIRDGKRAGDVVSRMRALFKKAREVKERFDLNEAIQEVVTLTQNEVERNKVTLRMMLAEDLPSIMGDRVQVQQVVMNLILNAIEAMSTVENHERGLVVRTLCGEGDQVRVAVEDSGTGFEPSRSERMFDAFYSTKPGGLGIGLSISRSIVEAHGGRLWATSNEGGGATFQFTLPS